MPYGVVGCGVFTQSKDEDVHRGIAKPFAQPVRYKFIVSLAEFCHNLRNASRSKVKRQTFNDPPLNVLTRTPAITKTERVYRRWDERRICRNKVEAFTPYGVKEVPDRNFNIRCA